MKQVIEHGVAAVVSKERQAGAPEHKKTSATCFVFSETRRNPWNVRQLLLRTTVVVLQCAFALSVNGQEAAEAVPSQLKGTIRSVDDSTPLSDCTVALEGTSEETATDAEGRFSFSDVTGEIAVITASRPGFIPHKQQVTIKPGQTSTVELFLLSEESQNVIEIKGKRLKADSAVALTERKRNSEVAEVMVGEDLDKTAESEIGGAVSRAPAVTVVDGRFAYVRGLGQRYSQTLLNQCNLPSPEPNRRLIPLDLFPTGIVEKLTISKTYTPTLPAEFAGGSIQIETLSIPDEPFLKFSLSTEYNSNTTFESFDTYEGGDLDIFTFEDGTRAIPGSFPRENINRTSTSEEGGFTNEDIQHFGREFDNNWETFSRTAPPDHKLTISGGDRFDLGRLGTMGVVGSLIWANKYQTIKDETFQVVSNTNTVEDPAPEVSKSFTLDRYRFESQLSGILNLTYQPNPAQTIGLRNFFSRSATDRVIQQEGYEGYTGRDIRVTQMRYVESSLYHSQLYGEHLLAGDHFFRWKTSYALSNRYQPDDRQIRYDLYEKSTGWEWQYEDIPGSGSRNFFDLDGNIYDVGLDYSIPFNPFSVPDPDPDPDKLMPYQHISFGGALMKRTRDFESRRFRFVPASVAGFPKDELGNIIDLSVPPEQLFIPENINPEGFFLSETTRGNDSYEAEQELYSAYLLTDFRIIPTVRLQGGARVESSNQEVTSFRLFGDPPDSVEASIDKTDIAPACNLSWEFLPDMQLRLAASQTVSRPEFRELARFEFQDIAEGSAARGNENLDRAVITNYDLRWEWFPTPKELLSFSIFGKEFRKPIEKVIVPTASGTLTTWENADEAELYGFEIEGRKNLDFIPGLSNFSVNCNFAYIVSEVSLKGGEDRYVQTNDSRALQGQPDYTLNIGLFYDNKEIGLSSGLLLNTFGERISAVGSYGIPDEEEQSRISLDFTISKKIGPGTLGFSLENILDEPYEFKQGSFTTQEYEKGISAGLSYSFDF